MGQPVVSFSQYMLSTNHSICGSHGQLLVQKEQDLVDQKVVGLMQCVLITGYNCRCSLSQKKKGRKVVFGDSLSSHFSSDVLQLCTDFKISFVCLVPNSTHLNELLDVTFYDLLKKKWQKIIRSWKLKHSSKSTISKETS